MSYFIWVKIIFGKQCYDFRMFGTKNFGKVFRGKWIFQNKETYFLFLNPLSWFSIPPIILLNTFSHYFSSLHSLLCTLSFLCNWNAWSPNFSSNLRPKPITGVLSSLNQGKRFIKTRIFLSTTMLKNNCTIALHRNIYQYRCEENKKHREYIVGKSEALQNLGETRDCNLRFYGFLANKGFRKRAMVS